MTELQALIFTLASTVPLWDSYAIGLLAIVAVLGIGLFAAVYWPEEA